MFTALNKAFIFLFFYFRNVFANIFHDHKDVISYGSCQFPTLGFVVERYKTIQEFISEKFWRLVVKHVRNGVDVEFNWERQRVFDHDVVQVLFLWKFG